MTGPHFKSGWLERDVERASKRADELRAESNPNAAAEKRLDDAIVDAFTNNDPMSIWFAVRVYISEVAEVKKAKP